MNVFFLWVYDHEMDDVKNKSIRLPNPVG